MSELEAKLLESSLPPENLRQKMWMSVESRSVSEELKNYFQLEYAKVKRDKLNKLPNLNYTWVSFIDDKLNGSV